MAQAVEQVLEALSPITIELSHPGHLVTGPFEVSGFVPKEIGFEWSGGAPEDRLKPTSPLLQNALGNTPGGLRVGVVPRSVISPPHAGHDLEPAYFACGA